MLDPDKYFHLLLTAGAIITNEANVGIIGNARFAYNFAERDGGKRLHMHLKLVTIGDMLAPAIFFDSSLEELFILPAFWFQ